MKVYDVATRMFLQVTKKENMTPTMYIISDSEEEKIKETLKGDGEVYLDETNNLIISGIKPSNYVNWDKSTKSWQNDEIKFQEWLAKTRSEMWEKIKDKRSLQAFTGVRIEDSWFHTDEESLRNYQLCWIRSELPEFNPPYWKTMSGSFISMTKDLLEKIIAKAYDKGQHDFKVAEMHRQALWKSNDPLNYDFSTGWSETYQG